MMLSDLGYSQLDALDSWRGTRRIDFHVTVFVTLHLTIPTFVALLTKPSCKSSFTYFANCSSKSKVNVYFIIIIKFQLYFSYIDEFNDIIPLSTVVLYPSNFFAIHICILVKQYMYILVHWRYIRPILGQYLINIVPTIVLLGIDNVVISAWYNLPRHVLGDKCVIVKYVQFCPFFSPFTFLCERKWYEVMSEILENIYKKV